MPYGKKRFVPRTRTATRLRAKPLGNRAGAKRAVAGYKAKTFQRAVKSVITKTMETKRLSVTLANNVPIAGGGLTHELPNPGGYLVPNVMYNLAVLQDVTSNTRIGDRISPISCYLRGLVHTNQFDTVSNINYRPFDVHILVFRHKGGRDLPFGPGELKLKYDTSADAPADVQINGTPINEMLPFGPQYRKIAHRVIRLRPPESHEIVAPANTIVTNPQTSNAPFYRRFAIKVPMPRTLTYRNPVTEFPVNYWFSVGAYIVDSNGVPVGQAQQRAKLYMQAAMSYKDA